jgi:hypothetical protein
VGRARSTLVLRERASCAPAVVESARRANVDIEYLGISALFAETRLYAGADRDWVLAPIDGREDPVVPRREQQMLRRVLSGVDEQFQLLYIAHEPRRSRYCRWIRASPTR